MVVTLGVVVEALSEAAVVDVEVLCTDRTMQILGKTMKAVVAISVVDTDSARLCATVQDLAHTQ